MLPHLYGSNIQSSVLTKILLLFEIIKSSSPLTSGFPQLKHLAREDIHFKPSKLEKVVLVSCKVF